jgi:hypothetical protein
MPSLYSYANGEETLDFVRLEGGQHVIFTKGPVHLPPHEVLALGHAFAKEISRCVSRDPEAVVLDYMSHKRAGQTAEDLGLPCDCELRGDAA